MLKTVYILYSVFSKYKIINRLNIYEHLNLKHEMLKPVYNFFLFFNVQISMINKYS